MKKGLIYLVLFLISVNIAFAGITIEDFERKEYNIGEKVNLKGNLVFDYAVEGSFKLDLYCNSESLPAYFSLLDLDVGEVYDFDFDIPTRDNLLGDCNFLLTVEGASEDFERSSNTFEITDELNADVNTDVLVAYPGGTVVVSGSVFKLNGEPIKNAGASITVDGEEKLISLNEGRFTYNLLLENDVKSGKHEVFFNSEDTDGNKGEDFASFKVIPVSTSLELKLDENYVPGEVVKGSVKLYDQAGDLIEEDVVIEIYDSEENLDLTKVVSTVKEFEIPLDSFSIPGEWVLKAKDGDLETKNVFNVGELKKLDLWLEDGNLLVLNSGNVDYLEPIQILLDGDNDVNVVKKTSLKPNQTIVLDLNKEVSYAGEYGVSVNGFPSITGTVVLEGKSISGSSYLGWGALTFVFLFFIYMVMRKGKNFVRKKPRSNKLNNLERKTTKADGIRQEDIDHLINKANPERKVENKDSEDKSMFKLFD